MTLNSRVAAAEKTLIELNKAMANRPTAKSHKPTEEELAKWSQEDASHPGVLAAYRVACAEARSVIACGEPREGGCNHRWGESCVCQRGADHPPPNAYPEAKSTGGHACRCGASCPVAEAQPSRRLADEVGPRPSPLTSRGEERPIIPCPNMLADGKRCGQVDFMETDKDGNRLPSGHRRCWGCDHVWPAMVARNGRRATAAVGRVA